MVRVTVSPSDATQFSVGQCHLMYLFQVAVCFIVFKSRILKEPKESGQQTKQLAQAT